MQSPVAAEASELEEPKMGVLEAAVVTDVLVAFVVLGSLVVGGWLNRNRPRR